MATGRADLFIIFHKQVSLRQCDGAVSKAGGCIASELAECCCFCYFSGQRADCLCGLLFLTNARRDIQDRVEERFGGDVFLIEKRTRGGCAGRVVDCERAAQLRRRCVSGSSAFRPKRRSDAPAISAPKRIGTHDLLKRCSHRLGNIVFPIQRLIFQHGGSIVGKPQIVLC